jgi:hypothetical protein
VHRIDQENLPHPCFEAAIRHFKNRATILSGLWLPHISMLAFNARQQ